MTRLQWNADSVLTQHCQKFLGRDLFCRFAVGWLSVRCQCPQSAGALPASRRAAVSDPTFGGFVSPRGKCGKSAPYAPLPMEPRHPHPLIFMGRRFDCRDSGTAKSCGGPKGGPGPRVCGADGPVADGAVDGGHAVGPGWGPGAPDNAVCIEPNFSQRRKTAVSALWRRCLGTAKGS